MSEREFWMQTYIAAIRAGQSPGNAAFAADQGIDHYRKSFHGKPT